MAKTSDAVIWAKFIALAFIWGSSFFFIKIALTTLTWGQVAWARVLIAGIFMTVLWSVTRTQLPREPKMWAHIGVAGIFGLAIPFIIYPWVEQYITSANTVIINGLTPIMAAIMAMALFRVEQFTINKALGVAVGLAGLVVVISPWNIADFGQALWAQIIAVGAPLMYGFSGAYLKKFVFPRGVSPRAITTIQVTVAAVFLLLLSPLIAPGEFSIDWTTVLAMGVIGIGGTGLAYLWYNDVLEAWGPTRASSTTYIMPIIGILLGVFFLGESVHWYEPVGGVIVIVGILLMRRGEKK